MTAPLPARNALPAAAGASLLLHGVVAAAVMLAWPAPLALPTAIPVTLFELPALPAAELEFQSAAPAKTAAAMPADVPPPALAAVEPALPPTPEAPVSMAATVAPPPPKPKPRPRAAPRPAKQAPAAPLPAPEPAAAAASAPVEATPAARAVTPAVAAAVPREPLVVLRPRFAAPPVPPTYPPRARELAQQGEVVVRALVRRRGAPEETVLWRSSGFRLLDVAALRAVSRWQFEAAVEDGRETATWVQVPVRFELKG